MKNGNMFKAHASAITSTFGAVLTLTTDLNIFEILATFMTAVAAGFAAYHYYQSARLKRVERRKLEHELEVIEELDKE